ncbi:hypothetical protein SQ11_06475 [Nitrosospira sp. NpAV]|nr:hypothetical protein SQ11_06475 [Nitrosospira sp. NpAV]
MGRWIYFPEKVAAGHGIKLRDWESTAGFGIIMHEDGVCLSDKEQKHPSIFDYKHRNRFCG